MLCLVDHSWQVPHSRPGRRDCLGCDAGASITVAVATGWLKLEPPENPDTTEHVEPARGFEECGAAHVNFTTWSPTDDRIAFTADLDDRDSDIYAVRAEAFPQRLTRSLATMRMRRGQRMDSGSPSSRRSKDSRTSRVLIRAIPRRKARLP